MSNPRMIKKVFLITLICTLGLMAQVYHVCVLYFDYETTVSVTIVSPVYHEFPTVSACIEHQLLKRKNASYSVNSSISTIHADTYGSRDLFKTHEWITCMIRN